MGDEHGGISIWSVGRGERLVDIPAQAPSIGAVARGPYDRLATPHALWDMTQGTIVAMLEPTTRSVSWCGDLLVTLGPKRITWREGTTGAVLATAPALTDSSRVTCAPDGRMALAYGYGAEVWKTHDRIGRKLGDRWVAAASWGPGNRVALGFDDALEIWRIAKNEPVREVRRRGGARVLAWRPDGLIAADLGASRRIDRDWTETGLSALRAATLATTGEWLTRCIPDSLDRCNWSEVAWSPGGARLATIVDSVLSVSDTPLGARPRSTPTRITSHPGSHDVSWSPDGAVLAAADATGVLLIRLQDGATLRLRDVWVGDRVVGLVDDGHDRFAGDSEASARIVKQAVTGSAGPPRAPPSRDPDLLAGFLRTARSTRK